MVGFRSISVQLMSLVGLVLSAVTIPCLAEACSSWSLAGQWTFVHSNGYSAGFVLQQSGRSITGQSGYGYLTGGTTVLGVMIEGQDAVIVKGSVDGSIDGAAFEITSFWDNGTIGVYSGSINAQGRLQGTTYDRMHPQSMASWYSDELAKCDDKPAAEQKRFISKIGKAVPPTTAAGYAGHWKVIANNGSWSFDMTFVQDGRSVSGTYTVVETGVKGTLVGVLDSTVLNFTWNDVTGGKYAGSGSLALSGDGRTFDGKYQVTVIPPGTTVDLVTGAWHGIRD